jgi:CRP-like cAMP-binding protein
MFDLLVTHLTATHTFTPAELEKIRSLTQVKKLRRKQFLLQEGDVCQYKIFVLQGLLKTYYLKEDGSEHIMGFAPENTWTTDYHSMTNNIGSRFNIEAMEDTIVVLFTLDNLQILVSCSPGLKAYTDDLIHRSLLSNYDRILTNISATSEEKYQTFVSKFPDLVNRVPLHLIASYLGISRETLSRIRHAQVRQSH